MKSIIQSLFFLTLIIVTTSCDMNVFQRGVMVRIQNVSGYNASSITLNGIEFGELQSGETSSYIDVEDLMVAGNSIVSSYDAELVEINIPNHKCELCGLGSAEHLSNGRYTLEFDVYKANKEEGGRTHFWLTLQD